MTGPFLPHAVRRLVVFPKSIDPRWGPSACATRASASRSLRRRQRGGPHAARARHDLTMDLTGPGRAYDKLGQRVRHGPACEPLDRLDGHPDGTVDVQGERWLDISRGSCRTLGPARLRLSGRGYVVLFYIPESRWQKSTATATLISPTAKFSHAPRTRTRTARERAGSAEPRLAVGPTSAARLSPSSRTTSAHPASRSWEPRACVLLLGLLPAVGTPAACDDGALGGGVPAGHRRLGVQSAQPCACALVTLQPPSPSRPSPGHPPRQSAAEWHPVGQSAISARRPPTLGLFCVPEEDGLEGPPVQTHFEHCWQW